jgi:A/G-specific adenine glycosylase
MDSVNKYTLVRELISDWYKENSRDFPWRTSKSLYQILITEILLQKTIALNVSNIYSDFFTKYDSFAKIYNANTTFLQSDIKVLGLSNKRAKILKDLSKLVVEDYDGEIPQDPGILKKINGIADYVSNAFACFGLNRRTFFYDVNIKRFIQRVFLAQDVKIKSDIISTELAKLLPKIDFKYTYWAILDFGYKICSKNKPKCEFCPISDKCFYFLNQL